ncbi:MAG: hypothetical protein ACMUHX_00910 [bacterium]
MKEYIRRFFCEEGLVLFLRAWDLRSLPMGYCGFSSINSMRTHKERGGSVRDTH